MTDISDSVVRDARMHWLIQTMPDLRDIEYIFADEKATYIFRQAVAIMNECVKHGNGPYGIDGGYIREKTWKIDEEFKRVKRNK